MLVESVACWQSKFKEWLANKRKQRVSARLDRWACLAYFPLQLHHGLGFLSSVCRFESQRPPKKRAMIKSTLKKHHLKDFQTDSAPAMSSRNLVPNPSARVPGPEAGFRATVRPHLRGVGTIPLGSLGRDSNVPKKRLHSEGFSNNLPFKVG